MKEHIRFMLGWFLLLLPINLVIAHGSTMQGIELTFPMIFRALYQVLLEPVVLTLLFISITMLAIKKIFIK